MKKAVICSSLTGNTNMLANVIKSHINEDDIIYFGAPSDLALKADLIYIGFWTDKGTCNKEIGDFIKKLTNQDVFIFGTCGFGASQDYFDKIIERVKAIIPSSCNVVGSFICQGKMKMAVKERYLKLKETNPNMPNIDMLIDNFDKALSHPDDNDIENLIKTLKS